MKTILSLIAALSLTGCFSVTVDERGHVSGTFSGTLPAKSGYAK